MNGWSFAFIGLPWWLVLPLAALLAWALARLVRPETAPLAPRARAGLRAMRALAALALAAMLLEPTLSHDERVSERPALAIAVDASGSMAATEPRMAPSRRLDEAIALGLVPPEARPVPWRRAAEELAAFDADLDMLAAATSGTEARRGETALAACARHLERARALEPDLAGSPEIIAHLKAQEALLERLRAALGGKADAAPAADLGAFREPLRAARAKLVAAQAASDAALAAGAAAGSPLAQGLARFGQMSRLARARGALERLLLPELSQRAQVEVVALSEDAPPLTDAAPAGATDFAGALSHLAREWPRSADTRAGGVLILSDGRQTAGGDPAPAARALAARGARVWCLGIGDPDPPRDAVVAELRAPQEVFKGETLRLDARIRIADYPADSGWDLVLSRDGIEVDRRGVRPSGAWQDERFERRDDEAGLHTWQARLERARPGGMARAGGGLTRELWTGVPGQSIRELAAALDKPPAASEVVPEAATADARENYAERLRGFVVPPLSGQYSFWISSDDAGELLLSDGPDPQHARSIAAVPEWCPPNVWDKYQSQRSEPITLEAGRPYYLEARHKQGFAGAHLSVGWQLPDARLERPIPGSRLSPMPRQGEPMPTAPEGDAPEASLANNQADCTVAVVDDPLAVLLVDAEPRWDSRYLAAMFERDPRVRVDRRWRAERLAHGERTLLPPTQDQLDAFDVVALGDIAASELAPDDQARLERYVSNRGGFLICLSGRRGMPASYGLGGIANLLPVRAVTASGAAQAVTVALPDGPRAADSPITAVLDDPALNRRLWPALPALQWTVPGVAAKPGADVLLVADDTARTPVCAVRRYGAGRVLWMGSDETWRWRDRLGERVHQTFWLQAVRWGLGSRLRGKDPRLQVAIDRALIEPGETIELRARARASSGVLRDAPSARIARLDDHGVAVRGTEQLIELREVEDAEGLFHATLGGLGEGRWTVAVSSGNPELAGMTEEREILVRPRASIEGVELAADPANLQRIAAAGGGRAGGLADAEAIAREIAGRLDPVIVPRRATWRLWSGYHVLATLTLLLSVEWWWRKRVGLP